MEVSYSNDSDKRQEINAVLSSYIALGGIPILVAILWLVGYIKRPSKDAIYAFIFCIVVALLWALWLRGFKLIVTDEYLEYRDGFYRSKRISLKDVAEMKHKWVQWKNLGRTLTIPRIEVITKDRKTAFLINDKPFGLDDLAIIRNLVKKANQPKEQINS